MTGRKFVDTNISEKSRPSFIFVYLTRVILQINFQIQLKSWFIGLSIDVYNYFLEEREVMLNKIVPEKGIAFSNLLCFRPFGAVMLYNFQFLF